VIKDEVVGKIRNGQKVVEVARHHAINEMTVRTWLERDTAEGASLVLEISRLRRENEALLRLAGQLTSESDVQKKISALVVRSLLLRDFAKPRKVLIVSVSDRFGETFE
jgi:transposase-like protein